MYKDKNWLQKTNKNQTENKQKTDSGVYRVAPATKNRKYMHNEMMQLILGGNKVLSNSVTVLQNVQSGGALGI